MRLEHLTNDLLQFVRTGTISRMPIDPAELVRDAAASVTGKGEIVIEASQAPARWSLDGGRIREALINLIDNAIAAGPPVAVTVRRDRDRLVLEVADRGPGVAEDDRDKVFEPFFTGKTQGTGLGLAIVRRVVELHHGTIAVYPNPGGGAVFRAELPET
jgi:signal transduction histidine kinase